MSLLGSAFLLKLTLPVVQEVLSSLTQQLNTVEDQALNPMRSMVQEVVGGVWVGQGADAFVEEVSSLMIPGVGRVGGQISGMFANIQRATQIIEQADQTASSMVQSVLDVFGNIYNG